MIGSESLENGHSVGPGWGLALVEAGGPREAPEVIQAGDDVA